ncbi:Phospholipase/lecithinase/hemolysin (fragment) [Hyella patelloides LEGE 07179]|uniref:Phospholipase/lecithinase/hemolysin n=1 Tax=Hyella patelloides LEGE 07179 TaxID=945734 RepID=A0A563VLL9_9CYAN
MLSNFDQLYVFGDSISDTGNLYNLTGGGHPSDADFNGSKRFSNGDIWVDHFADELDITIDPFTENTGINDSLNFAIGGANSDRSHFSNWHLPPELQRFGLEEQIDAFEDLANNQSSQETFDDDLFSISIGANDYYSLIGQDDPNTRKVETNFPKNWVGKREKVIEVVDTNIKDAIDEIIDAGGKNIVLFNLPDLNETPLGDSLGRQNQGHLKSLTNMHNRSLSRLVKRTERANPDVNIIEVDLNEFVDDIMDNPNEFGFTNVTDNFSGGDIYHGKGFGMAEEPSVGNADEYFFWDSAHVTTKVHSLMADLVIDTLANEGLIME